MTSRREIVAVMVVSILAMGPVMVGLVTFNSFSLPFLSPPPLCSVPSANSTILSNNSSEVLAPAGDEMAISHGGSTILEFTINAPGDLQGAWESSAPLGITVLSTLSGMFSLPPVPGYFLRGAINESVAPPYAPLYPGTYAVTAFPLGWWNASQPTPGPVNLTVTQSIAIVFDRDLTILQRPAGLNVSADSYACWQIPFPAGAEHVWLALPPLPATIDQYTLALFPQSVFEQFQTNRSVISSPSVWEIWQGMNGTPSGYISLPLNVPSGDLLVFYNSSSSGTTLTVPYPIEVSYVVDS